MTALFVGIFPRKSAPKRRYRGFSTGQKTGVIFIPLILQIFTYVFPRLAIDFHTEKTPLSGIDGSHSSHARNSCFGTT